MKKNGRLAEFLANNNSSRCLGPDVTASESAGKGKEKKHHYAAVSGPARGLPAFLEMGR